jgi:hypothetical protein
MAALCQVHLLNNLRSRQQPDLLFVNAFLIAIVTGFMSRGLGFPIAFAVFVPCFVVGLQVLSATRGGHEPSAAAVRRLALDGSKRAAVLLAASFLVFFFWPRDFDRKAFLHGKLDFSTGPSRELEVGFGEELVLGRRGPVATSDREALRVTVLEGDPRDVPVLWRGATLGTTDNGQWRPVDHAVWRDAGAADEPWNRRAGRLERDARGGAGAIRVEVLRRAQGTERLFAPLATRAMRLAAESQGAPLRTRLDGTIEVGQLGDVAYELTLGPAAAAELGGARREELPAALEPYVELPLGADTERARDLAARLVRTAAEDAAQHEVVARLREHLEQAYTYVPPGSEGAARTLDEFLRGDAGAHCEFFASALATMLRSLGIPCRVVTGYRGGGSGERVIAFPMASAHAWVEVHDPDAGWYAVDPSPASGTERAGASLWARITDTAAGWWTSVTDFDSEARTRAVAWLRGLPARTARSLADRPFTSSASALLLALACALFVRRRRARIHPEVRAWRRAVRRAGLRPEPNETPRELLERARSIVRSTERVEALEHATRRHEAARYAS